MFYFSINKPPSFFFFLGGGGEEYQLYLIAAGHLKGGGSANPSTLPLDPPMRCTCTHFFIVIISILRPEPRLLKLLFLHRSFFFISAITIETLSGGRGRDLSLIFFAYSQKIQPRKASLYFFHQKSKHSYFY